MTIKDYANHIKKNIDPNIKIKFDNNKKWMVLKEKIKYFISK